MNDKCQNLIGNYKKLLEIKDGFDFVNLSVKNIRTLKDELLKLKKSINDIMSVDYNELELIKNIDFNSNDIRDRFLVTKDFGRMDILSVDESADGNIIVSFGGKLPDNQNIAFLDKKTFEIIDIINIKRDVRKNSKFVFDIFEYAKKSKDKDKLVLNFRGKSYIYNIKTREIDNSFGSGPSRDICSYIEDNKFVYYCDPAVICRYDKIKHLLQVKAKYSNDDINKPHFEFESDGILFKTSDNVIILFSKTKAGFVRFFDKDLRLIRDTCYGNYPGGINKVEESVDRNNIFFSGDGGFFVMDNKTYQIEKVYDREDMNCVNDFSQSPDGKHVVLFYNGSLKENRFIKVLNLETFEIVKTIDGQSAVPKDSVTLRDGRVVAFDDMSNLKIFGNGKE